jgi:hypothetical protein
MAHKVLAAAFHRNGMAGVGFNVAIVADRIDGVKRRMLVIDFDVDESNHDENRGYTAVLDLDMAASGNIYARPNLNRSLNPIPGTGDNAWRGDVLGDAYRTDIRAAVEAVFERETTRDVIELRP